MGNPILLLRRAADLHRLRRGSDRAEVQAIAPLLVLIASFALAALITMVWLDHALGNKAVDVSACVESGVVVGNGDPTACNQRAADTHSFSQTNEYLERY